MVLLASRHGTLLDVGLGWYGYGCECLCFLSLVSCLICCLLACSCAFSLQSMDIGAEVRSIEAFVCYSQKLKHYQLHSINVRLPLP